MPQFMSASNSCLDKAESSHAECFIIMQLQTTSLGTVHEAFIKSAVSVEALVFSFTIVKCCIRASQSTMVSP